MFIAFEWVASIIISINIGIYVRRLLFSVVVVVVFNHFEFQRIYRLHRTVFYHFTLLFIYSTLV